MTLHFKARVLLELGAELISSDAVAIYELVKNSLDAGSKGVEIFVDVAMQHSAYSQLMEVLEGIAAAEDAGTEPEVSLTLFNEWVERNLEDDAQEEWLGRFREGYGVPETAKEALETLAKAYVDGSRIFIRDRGHGMSRQDLLDSYLTVGTPTRLMEKTDAIKLASAGTDRLHHKYSVPAARMPLGEKGIGRLSAMRLGHLVRVRTKRTGSRSWNHLELDWRPAFADPSLDADALNFEPTQRRGTEAEADEQGTSIAMRDLQSNWSSEKVHAIARTDLAKLADPFATLRANKFISFSFQGKPISVPFLDREPLKGADATCEARFEYDENGEPTLAMNVNYHTYSHESTIRLTGDHLRATVREEPGSTKRKKRTPLVDGEIIGRALKHLGPWEMKFYWFNRGKVQRENSDYYQGTLKPFLLQWAGGFLVYRDGFRVYPYGERSDDWLDLDRKALAAGAYKLNRAQMVGYLRISSIANPLLLDQTNREGFRDSYDKEALRRLLRYVILGFCRPFLEEIDRKVAPLLEDMVVAVEKQITDSKGIAIESLKGIQARAPEESESIGKVMHHLQEVSDAWERAKLRIAHFEEEIETYIHLAGVGLMLEFIAHELARITQDTLKAVSAGKYSPEVVEAQLKTLEKRVRILDELSVPGRQIRKDTDIVDLTEMLKEFHESKSEREGISVEIVRKKANAAFVERVEKGQLLQILDNLFSNSFYWLVNRIDRSESGKIRIELDAGARQIRFSDNGPGISEDRAEAVFQQFVTSKPPREGRGLGLYIARRLAQENKATLGLAPADSDGMHRTFVLSFGQDV